MREFSDRDSDDGRQVRDSDFALWSFLDELRTNLRAMRDDRKALRFSLRLTCEHFNVTDGCLGVLPPARSQTELISVIPRGGEWDLDLVHTKNLVGFVNVELA